MTHQFDINRQSGNVMLSVMVISAIMMAIGASLYNNYIVSEADAVEKSLIDARVYWAMMGNTNLLLGRTTGQGIPCDTGGLTTSLGSRAENSDVAAYPLHACASDGTGTSSTASDNMVRVGALQYYFDGPNQFNNDAGVSSSISNPGSRTWRYPVENYVGADVDNKILIRSIVRQRRDPSTSTYLSDDGRFRLDSSVSGVGSVPALGGLMERFPTLIVGFCVRDQIGYSGINHSLRTPAVGSLRQCGSTPITGVSPATSEGYNQIEFVQWNMDIT